MRSSSIFSWVFVLTATIAQGQYFPKSALDSTPRGLKDEWYSSQLRALQEPSLFELARVPSTECYRFLWLRTFNHPIAIRLEPKPDGTGVLTTKVASGAGGFRPGALSESNSRVLTKEETQAFIKRLKDLDFWHAVNPVNDQKGTDGSQWIIEAVKDGEYHVVDRWLPKIDGYLKKELSASSG